MIFRQHGRKQLQRRIEIVIEFANVVNLRIGKVVMAWDHGSVSWSTSAWVIPPRT